MLLTQTDVATQLRVAKAVIAQATREGKLKHVLLPGHKKPRYTQEHIDTFIKQQERGNDA